MNTKLTCRSKIGFWWLIALIVLLPSAALAGDLTFNIVSPSDTATEGNPLTVWVQMIGDLPAGHSATVHFTYTPEAINGADAGDATYTASKVFNGPINNPPVPSPPPIPVTIDTTIDGFTEPTEQFTVAINNTTNPPTSTQGGAIASVGGSSFTSLMTILDSDPPAP